MATLVTEGVATQGPEGVSTLITEEVVVTEEMIAKPGPEEWGRKETDWHQLLVNIGTEKKPVERVVYLDTASQGLLYDPPITNKDANLATQFSFGIGGQEGEPVSSPEVCSASISPKEGGPTVGPGMLRNRVTPKVAARIKSPGSDKSPIIFQNFGNGDLIKEDGDNGKFAIYANAPKGKRFYFRPTKETSGKPQKNQILAKKLSKEKEFQSSKNFVFFWAP